MINKETKNLFLNNISCIVTETSNISMVFEDNSLSHAMLILRESNYTQIPVLNYDKKFIGLISLHQIYKKLDEELFNGFENLHNLKVKDYVDEHFAVISENFDLEQVFKLLIDYNFINLVDDENNYKGMITRSAVLKQFNRLAHTHKNIFNYS